MDWEKDFFRSCSCAKTDLTWKAGEGRHGVLSQCLPGQGYLSFLGWMHTTICLVTKWTWKKLILLPNSSGCWVLASSITAQFAALSDLLQILLGQEFLSVLNYTLWPGLKQTFQKWLYLIWTISQSLETRWWDSKHQVFFNSYLLLNLMYHVATSRETGPRNWPCFPSATSQISLSLVCKKTFLPYSRSIKEASCCGY